MHQIALTHYLDQLSAEIPGYRFVLDTRYINGGVRSLPELVSQGS